MTRRRDELIEALVRELQPVRHALSPSALAIGWLAGSWLLAVVLLTATGPMRPGWGAQLSANPRLQLESLLGFAAGALAILGVGRLSIPGPRRTLAQAAPALLLLATWVASYLWELWQPAIAPSMLGKRAHCSLEIFSCAAPLVAAGFWLARAAAPLARAGTGALLGAAAAAIPALFMQFACMYEAVHVLTHHLAPIGGVALLGAILGPLVLRRI